MVYHREFYCNINQCSGESLKIRKSHTKNDDSLLRMSSNQAILYLVINRMIV